MKPDGMKWIDVRIEGELYKLTKCDRNLSVCNANTITQIAGRNDYLLVDKHMKILVMDYKTALKVVKQMDGL